MSSHNIYFLWEIRKMSIFWASKLVGQVDFDHLLVRGQVIKFNNSTPMPSWFFRHIHNITYFYTSCKLCL